MNRRNIILTALIALTVFNVSSLITIFFWKPQHSERSKPAKTMELPEGKYARWFRDRLQLSDDQFEVFRNANRTYHEEGRIIVDELSATRAEILSELGKSSPDNTLLGKLAMKIGTLHTQLKELTINYYLTMKTVCNEEQKTELYEIFKVMTDVEGNAAIPPSGNAP